MTQRLYYHDAYLQHFNAQVVSVSGDGLRVVLDRTAFYPTSGGQPHDRGVMNGVAVVDVIDREDTIEHVLSQALDSQTVTATIDWQRRLDHMQQHTAQHLLSAVLQEEFGLVTVSFHLGADYSTIDVEPGNAAPLAEIEDRANEVLRRNLATAISFEDAETAQGLRKASERTGEIRVVTIDGLDRSACGGTHVSRTGEIGVLRLGKTEKVRKALRIYFYAGARALLFSRAQYSELARSEAQLRERLGEAEKAKLKLSVELAEMRGQARFQSGARWVESVAEISEALRGEANAFLAGPGAFVMLYAPSSGAVLLGAEESRGIDCGAALRRVAGIRGGKGGGTAKLAQGNVGPGLDLEMLEGEVLGG